MDECVRQVEQPGRPSPDLEVLGGGVPIEVLEQYADDLRATERVRSVPREVLDRKIGTTAVTNFSDDR